MGLLSFLAGNSSSVDKVVDAGIKGMDALVFTEEEKAEYHKKLQETYLEFVRISATESSAQSISRRMICLPVVYTWLGLIITNVVCDIAFETVYESVLVGIEQMSGPAMAALGFYVGRHLVNNWKGNK